MSTEPRARRACLIPLLSLLASSGCIRGDDDDDSSTPQAPAGIELYVSNNGTANRGDVDRFNEDLTYVRRFVAGNNQGIQLDIAGNLYQAGDDRIAPGSIRFISAIANAPNDDPFDTSLDRELGGPGTTLTELNEPRGIEVVHIEGYLLVANHGSNEILVFGTAAGGDVPPLARTPLDFTPWDLAFDGITDRLWVTTTVGAILTFDDYLANFGAAGPDRMTYASDGTGDVISSNLRGLSYDFASDALVVTDARTANASQGPDFASDGALYVMFGASVMQGLVEPGRTISGPSTLLGNPVDCLIDTGDDLLVAEKANDFLLRFENVLSGMSGDVAPNASSTEIKPESIEGASTAGLRDADVSDVDDPAVLLISIGTTSNPPAADPDFGGFARLTTDLRLELGTLDLDAGLGGLTYSLENVTYDIAGDAFVTFDDGTDLNGGVLVVNRAARARGPVTQSRDRVIHGPNTTLVSPKGVEIVGAASWVLVAESNDLTPAIVGFGTQAGGDVAPAFRTELVGIGLPWDLDYDPVEDRLFVALTNGTVAVFDDYTAVQGVSGADRLITPMVGGAPVTELRGIVHTGDLLILSDVGVVDDATDGRIMILSEAATASGPHAADVSISGANTLLGDPTDLAFDGASLYVAERAGDLLLRFDGILSAASGDVAPDIQEARTKPESVVLAPSFLSREPTY